MKESSGSVRRSSSGSVKDKVGYHCKDTCFVCRNKLLIIEITHIDWLSHFSEGCSRDERVVWLCEQEVFYWICEGQGRLSLQRHVFSM